MTNVVKKVSINGQVVPFGGGGSEGQEVVYLTQAEYDNLTPVEKADTTKNYVIIGQGSIPVPTEIDAEDVNFDNTGTGMQSDNVQDAIEEVFQSVSNGKELIADAITDKGVSTSATDSFATMASNIESLNVGGKYTNNSGGDVLTYGYRAVSGSYIDICTSSEQTENSDSIYYYACLFQRGSGDTYGGIVVKYNNTTKKIYSVGLNVTILNSPNSNLKFFSDGDKVWLADTYQGNTRLFGYFDETNAFTQTDTGAGTTTDITASSGYVQASRSDGGASGYNTLGTVNFVAFISESINSYRSIMCCVI